MVAACVLGPNRLDSLARLDDSKKLTEAERERLFPLIRRYALAYHVVFIDPAEVDRRGVHIANIEGMRRAVAGLALRPGYVLSDGFRVPGLTVPSLWAGWGWQGRAMSHHRRLMIRFWVRVELSPPLDRQRVADVLCRGTCATPVRATLLDDGFSGGLGVAW